MPRRRPNLAARWSSYRARYKGTPGVTLSSPLSPVTYPVTRLRGLVEIAPGADLTADPATWSWVDITQWVRHDLGISTVVGRRDQAGTVDPSRAALKLDNRDGRFSRRNPAGPYYGQLTRNTPIRLSVDPGDGMHARYHGFVNEWPKRWDRSGNDSTVTVTCGGVLRRLQRSQPLQAPLRRAIGSASPDAYWPLDDGSDASFAASGISGGRPLTRTGSVDFGATSLLPAGSTACADLSGGGSLQAPTGLSGGVVDSWEIELCVGWDTLPGAGIEPVIVACDTPGGSIIKWGVILVDTGSERRLGIWYTNGVDIFTASSGSLPEVVAGRVYHFRILLQQNGANINYFRFRDGDANSSGVVAASTLYAPTRITFNPLALSSGQPPSVCQAAIWSPARSSADTYAAADAYVGEQAHERIIRLCGEEGVQVHCVAGASAALGPQQPGTILDVLRDAERADLGVLYEHEFGLGYKAQSEYYNQPVELALDFDSGHVGDPPEADDSDLRFRNQWTVRRSGGSSATHLDPHYSTAQGLYEGSTTVNVETDEQLIHVAGWMVHRDTTDEDYWTGLKLRFSRSPNIIPGWTALPFGARLTVANPPTQADPGSIDAIVEGWSERWDQVMWEATLNTSPASVYRVGVYGDSATRYDSRATALAEDLDTTETAVDVTVSAGNVGWITTALHPTKFPLDIGVGGEQMTATASVDNGGGSYTFTVVRSVNGIVKTHASGAQVGLWRPARYAL